MAYNHRELAHHNSKLKSPIELKGRSVIKSPMTKETYGRWSNLVEGKSVDRIPSPEKVVKRVKEDKHAQRTIHPQCNTEVDRPISRKIKSSTYEPTNMGSIVNLMKRNGGTIKDVSPSTKKIFKEKAMTGENLYSQDVKGGVKLSQKRFEDYASSISTLASPVYTERGSNNFRDELGFLRPSSGIQSPNAKTKQTHLRSAIGSLPLAEESKKVFHDYDEVKNWRSANNPKVAQHLATTLHHQPTPGTEDIRPRRDPNKNNPTTYDDIGKPNTFTRGKKTQYREHFERNTSAVWQADSVQSSAPTSTKCGHQEPLNALFLGRRAISPKPVYNNLISEPPTKKENPRGSTVYSYRTYSSQIIF